MGGVEFSLGTLTLCEGISTEEVWACHEDVQDQDDLQNDAVHNNNAVQEIDDVHNNLTCLETCVVKQEHDKEVEIAERDTEQISECDITEKSAEWDTEQMSECEATGNMPRGMPSKIPSGVPLGNPRKSSRMPKRTPRKFPSASPLRNPK